MLKTPGGIHSGKVGDGDPPSHNFVVDKFVLKTLVDKNKRISEPGNGDRTLPPPAGSGGKPGRVGKARDGTERPAPETLSRHRRALGGRRT